MKDWKDLGSGQWKLTITVDGDPTATPSVFRGTREEILDKLADSQANANRRIATLKSGNGGGPPPSPDSGPKPLTAAERMETVADLQNPATVDRAITRVMESVVGPVGDLQQDRKTRIAVGAAEAFVTRTPEWFNSDFNKNTLTTYMQTQGLDPTNTQSYTRAFEELTAAQLLQPRPTEDEPPADSAPAGEPNAPAEPTHRPRTTRYSTSIRSSDISGRAPVPSGKPHLKYTREQLANLSADDYKRLMRTDRAELERCESYYAKNPVRRTG